MTTPMSLKPYDKFSSISNKTMVAIFPNVCLWRRSYAQNWEVLTLKNCYSIEPPSYASTGYVVASIGLVFFLLFRKNLGNLREFFGQIVYRPPGKKLPVRLCKRINQCGGLIIFKCSYLLAGNSFLQ